MISINIDLMGLSYIRIVSEGKRRECIQIVAKNGGHTNHKSSQTLKANKDDFDPP